MKFDICGDCHFYTTDMTHVCNACDEGDQFEPTDEPVEPDEDEEGRARAVGLGAGKKIIRLLEAA